MELAQERGGTCVRILGAHSGVVEWGHGRDKCCEKRQANLQNMPGVFALALVKGFANVAVSVVPVDAGRLDIGCCRNKTYLDLSWVTGGDFGFPVLSVAVERFGMGTVDLWRCLLHSVWVDMDHTQIETEHELSALKRKSFRLRPAQLEHPWKLKDKLWRSVFHFLCNLLLSVGYRYSRADPPAFDRNNERRWQVWHVNQAMYLLLISDLSTSKIPGGATYHACSLSPHRTLQASVSKPRYPHRALGFGVLSK